MNQMTTAPISIKKAGYTGVKVSSMIKALLCRSISKHLRLVQIDELNRLKVRYDRQNYISKPQMSFLWSLYWNFVLNDFRFEDDVNYREKKITVEVTVLEKYTKLNQNN